jgi:diguanylate cyclase (GGDEF)-like protein
MLLDKQWTRMSGQTGKSAGQNPPWWQRKPVLPIVAVLLAALAVPAVRDIVVTVGRDRQLHASGRDRANLYGQLQSRAQEARRRCLYALIVENSNERAHWVPSIREADQVVSLLAGRAIFRGPDPGSAAVIRQFASQWEDYTAIRDDVLALALEGRTTEAAKMEAESGTPAFEKAQATLANAEPLLNAWLTRQEEATRWALARDAGALAALFLIMIGLMGALLWVDRKGLALLESLEESNDALRAEKETEHQHNRVLELIGGKEPLDTVLDAVVAALHRQQPDPDNGCAVLAFQGTHPTAYVRGVSHPLVAALKRFAVRMAAGEPVDACKDELRELARLDGFPECRFAPVWLRGNEDGGWIVVLQKYPPEHAATDSVLIHRAQRAATLAIENTRLYEQLAQQAHYDALTQLPNRLLFHDRLHQAMAHARRHRSKVAILWLDLDGFKRINDTLGHRSGDALLRLAAQRLQGCVREADTLARLGGDEFTVVLKDVRDLAAARLAAEEFLKVLRQPFRLDSHDLSIGASIGVSVYPDHGEDVTAVVKSADIAMYRAKALGKNRVETFDVSMADAERERLELEIELRAGIASEEFELYYQPQVDLDGRLAGLEALVRWNHKAKGVVSPGWFIPMAETSGLIVPLGAWVLRRACLQCREWMDLGLAVPTLAVNVSTVQLTQSEFAAYVKQCLDEVHLAPEHLELEITESSFLSDAVETNQQIERIRALGVNISIDDFGTGYSSLSYLHRLPVDRLKIDRSFVRDINNVSAGTASVVRAIVVMAHSLDLSVVAEGVESAEQLEAIREAGCDFAQGFYFYRPLPVDVTARLLASSEAAPARRDIEAFQEGVEEGASAVAARIRRAVSSPAGS